MRYNLIKARSFIYVICIYALQDEGGDENLRLRLMPLGSTHRMANKAKPQQGQKLKRCGM